MTDSFAIFRQPHGRECCLVLGAAQSIASLHGLGGKSGFVIAPFSIDDSSPIVLIEPKEMSSHADVRNISTELQDIVNQCCAANVKMDGKDSPTREDYSADFLRFHSMLGSGQFSKIVLARKAFVETGLRPFEMFAASCEKYPRMFIALFSSPLSGTWLMATPEVLIERKDGKWRTMALAGTMKLSGEELLFDEPIGHRQTIMWEEKNIQEQRYVATYINRQLRPFASEIEEDGPRTVRAGNLVHLRSDFTFSAPEQAIGALLEALHPTPAVCGLPKDATKAFIIANEHSPRTYYSGFAGPLDLNGQTSLYVSLRCMSIGSGICELYAGGGLLKESTEQSEWDETEAKMMTMREICSATR